MELIQNWKTLQRMGNVEFERGQWQKACHYYMNSILLLQKSLTDVLHQHPQQASEVIICLSIAVQNLSETYYRQNRVNCCLSLLKQSLRDFQRLQNTLPAEHPAAVALLRESCQLRQLLFVHKGTEGQAASMEGTVTSKPDSSTRSELH